MMHPILRLIICFAVVTLVSCANHVSVDRANHRATCKHSCQQRLITCSKVCHNNCQECAQSSNQTTIKNYDKYKHEQCIQGGIIVRDLNSYRDPLLGDYNVCTASCNGIIHKRLQIAPVCCE